jgi:hypothetical protein
LVVAAENRVNLGMEVGGRDDQRGGHLQRLVSAAELRGARRDLLVDRQQVLDEGLEEALDAIARVVPEGDACHDLGVGDDRCRQTPRARDPSERGDGLLV